MQQSQNDLANFLGKVGHNPYERAKELLKDEIVSYSQQRFNPAIKKLPIKCTTIQGSKGLAADFVFITHFDDQYFIKDKDEILDQEICNFLVALTRAKRKVFLISSNTKEQPTFLSWINEERLDRENE